MKMHSKEKKHKCYVCDFQAITRSNLMQHMQTHTDARPYKCDYCGKLFKGKKQLFVAKCFLSLGNMGYYRTKELPPPSDGAIVINICYATEVCIGVFLLV